MQSAKTSTIVNMDSHDHGAAAAAERIVASQIDMYRGSCAVMAVEAWRMWNEFPDQRQSVAMTAPLLHYGNLSDTLDEIGILMAHMVVSPVLDDSFILHNLFGRSERESNSTFLRICLMSALMVKYGKSNVRSSFAGIRMQHSNLPYCCDSDKLFAALSAYVARRRMNTF